MDTDKRFTYTHGLSKSFGASITIQLPTTSANQSNHLDYSNNSNNNVNNTAHNHNYLNVISTNNVTGYTNGVSIDRCHHQAATRSLLYDHPGTTASSTDSDDSPTPPPHYHEIPGIVPAYQGRSSGPPPSYDDVVNPNAHPPTYNSLFGQVREARKTSNGLVDLFRQLFLILIGTLGCTMIIGFLLLIPITMILIGIVYVNECRAENIPSFLVIGGLVWIVKNILNCYNQFKRDSSTVNRPPPRRTLATSSTLAIRSSPPSVIVVNQQPTTTITTNNSILTTPQSHTSTQSSTNQAREHSATRLRDSSLRNRQAANRVRNPSMIGITSFKCESLLNYFLIVWFLAGCIVVYRIYEPDYDNPLSSSYCNRTVYLYAFWLMTSTFIIMALVLSCLCCLMASSLMSNRGR